MAISGERAKELFQQLKTRFIDTVDPEELEKEGKKFEERLKQIGHDHFHGHGHHDHGHHHDHDHHHDSEWLEDRSREFEKEIESAVSRAVYCDKLFEVQTDLSREAFEIAVAKQVVGKSFFKDVKSVASFGCGPAPELVGFQAFLGELAKENQPSGNLELVGYDAEEGWREYVDELGYTFKCNMVDAQFLREMPKYDIIILCFSTHHMPFSKPSGGDKNMWELLGEKGRLLVVIDMNIPDQDEMLNKEKFTLLKMREKHPLVEAFAVNAHFKLLQ